MIKENLPETKWPESLPHPHEEKIFSIICGNTHIKWAIHEGVSMEFTPTCCWRTKLLSDSEMNDQTPIKVLSHHLPQPALMAIFGRSQGNMTRQLAQEHSQGRAAVLLTIYLVSTNDEQARRIAWCFQHIPTRIYRMRPDDFFSKRMGRYDSMGVDRLASMKAVGDVSGFPALVIDGGTCLTYTAADADGKIVGGGISLGLLAKLHAISEKTIHAQGMEVAQETEAMMHVATDMVESSKPLDFFACNTKQAVISTVLHEYALLLRGVIKSYLRQFCDGNKTPAGNTDENGSIKPKIMFTGGDGDLFAKLVSADSNLVMTDERVPPYEHKVCKHLMAFGIAVVLKEKQKEHKEEPVSELDKRLIGCRVAKKFEQPDEDGDFVYRGTISGSVRDGKTEASYLVLYDDVDTEELSLVEVHAALLLYANVGEKIVGQTVHKMVTQKKNKALDAASKMEELDEEVKSVSEQNRSEVATKATHYKAAQLHKANVNAKNAAGEKKLTPSKRASSSSSTPKQKKPKTTDPKTYINRRLCKFFGEDESDLFFGIVASYDEKVNFWHIDYDDGDEEEYDENDVKKGIELYQRNKDLDPTLKKQRMGQHA